MNEINEVCHLLDMKSLVAHLRVFGNCERRWRRGMRRRKPDMVMALTVVFLLGVLATGYAQALSGS
ncbi:hypothetical protein F1978_12695 [Vreelandella piezotolerans]|nr:hypothetical protein F1978_12695 [Halomonas piezotolerans]TNH19014.1 hypothetical protein FHJ80_06635 [Halomonas sp. BL6]